MLVVWEPILLTDLRAPTKGTLARIPDRRVRQFWDPHHEVSRALSRMAKLRLSGGSNTGTDTSSGVHWDEAIVYAPHSKWEDLPTPLFWRGPVYRSISGLTAAVSEVSSAKLLDQSHEAPPGGGLYKSQTIRALQTEPRAAYFSAIWLPSSPHLNPDLPRPGVIGRERHSW